MDEITPEQKKKLGTWVAQRDAIILDIAHKRDEERALTESVNNLCKTKSEVYDEIKIFEGRLEELKKKDAESKDLISSELADLNVQKSKVQSELSALQGEIVALERIKEVITNDISVLSTLHEKVFDKVNGLEAIVGNIVRITSENAVEVKNTLIMAASELQKVINVGEQNVEKTNKVLLDIPKMVVDLHRDIIRRRMAARNRSGLTEVDPQ